jgi:predicted metal-dependent hydrolase
MASDGASILAGGQIVPLRVNRHAAARGYRLRMGRDGTARLTMPQRGSERSAIAWAQDQSDWIAAQMAHSAGQHRRLCDGASFPLDGQDVTICADPDGPRRVRLDGTTLHVGGPADLAGPRILRWLKARARTVLDAETRAIASRHDLIVSSVGIGDPRTRWGSCTTTGAIRYSWRLILAPPEVRIATVAHEVAHLRHHDHSPAFHAFHRLICPSDTQAARAWLRQNGAMLHGVGV